MRRLAVAAFAAVLLCSAACAQEIAVTFDPGKSNIKWTLAGNVHTVHGTFRLKDGHVSVNPATGSISGELLVDAASGDSGNGARDRTMHKEILQSAVYKEIRFTPEKVDGALAATGHSSLRVSGAFLIHGGAHQVSIPLEMTLSGSTVTGSGKFSIPYVDWGMKDPSNFLFKVDKSVEVEIEAVGSVTGK